jgi:hypothetical protein
MRAKVNFQSNNIAFMSNDRASQRIAFLAVPGLRDDSEQFVHTGVQAGATFEQPQKDTYAGVYPPSKPPNLQLPLPPPD